MIQLAIEAAPVIVVEVLPSDVDSSCRFRANACPVQRAIKRALPESGLVIVNSHLAGIELEARMRWFRLPPWVTTRIKAFDATGEMAPFSFELDLSLEEQRAA